MKIAVISTSINPSPEAYAQWADIGDLYVAGDLNSPRTLQHYVNELGGTYLTPDAQAAYTCSEVIGWRNIQRRNLALLQAFQAGDYDYYITVDDDNLPGDAADFHAALQIPFADMSGMSMVVTDGLWFNPGRLGHPPFRQRGLPANYRDLGHAYRTEFNTDENVKLGVLQCTILGDPDCDAVQRIVQPVNVRGYDMEVFPETGVYAPFNSQATIWPARFAPLMAVLPFCRRFDDIYASLIATRILHHLNHVVLFGKPHVYQERNIHDLGKDLAAEVDGMQSVQHFVEVLQHVTLDDSDDIMDHYERIVKVLLDNGCLPISTYQFVNSYLTDLADTNWSA